MTCASADPGPAWACGRCRRGEGGPVKKIRERDDALHGTANPSLLTYRDEARHYSGRMTEQNWTCPFTARTGG
ncbi:YqcI/YcgG family protein [Streptomyces sp. NPDC001340]